MKETFPRLPGFVAARFSRGEAFGLHLTAGIVVMLLAAWLFGLIASGVRSHTGLSAFDTPLANWFHAHRGSGWTPFMMFITDWHQPAGVLVMAAMLGAWFHMNKLRYWLLALVLSVPGGMLLNVLIKYTFRRVRPTFDDPLVTLVTYSFPSGHTSGATFFYGLLAAFLVCTCTRWSTRLAAVSAATFMVALVALSRVYVGAHYLSDVLAAIAEGCAWLAICITAVSTLRRRSDARSKQQGE
jgi:undecaprenyl-diphosphatase